MIGYAAIYDQDGVKIDGFSSLKIEIKRDSKVIGAPLESGQTSLDNKVREPTQVIATGIVHIDSEGKYRQTLSKLLKIYNSRDFKFCSATDGINSASNLILKTYPTTRSVDKYDWISLELVFVEAMNVQRSGGSPASSDNSDFRNIGYVPSVPASGSGFANVA